MRTFIFYTSVSWVGLMKPRGQWGLEKAIQALTDLIQVDAFKA